MAYQMRIPKERCDAFLGDLAAITDEVPRIATRDIPEDRGMAIVITAEKGYSVQEQMRSLVKRHKGTFEEI